MGSVGKALWQSEFGALLFAHHQMHPVQWQEHMRRIIEKIRRCKAGLNRILTLTVEVERRSSVKRTRRKSIDRCRVVVGVVVEVGWCGVGWCGVVE